MGIDKDLILTSKSTISSYNYKKNLKNLMKLKDCKYMIIDYQQDKILLLVEIDKCKISKDGTPTIVITFNKQKAKILDCKWYLFKEKPTEFNVLEYGTKKWEKYCNKNSGPTEEIYC